MTLALSEILAIFDKPEIQESFTVSQWETAFEDHVKRYHSDAPPAGPFLKRFVRQQVEPFLTAIDVKNLQRLIGEFNKDILALPEVRYETFTLSKDLPTYSEVQDTINKIHAEVGITAAKRDACNHYTTVLKQAEEHVKSFIKTLTAFVMDETFLPAALGGVAARKRYLEPLLVDLEIAQTRIVSQRQVVTSLHDNILGQRLNLLMRSDSAVRMLIQKVDEGNQFSNRGQSRHMTTQASPGISVDDADFSLEPVRRP